MTVWIDGNAIDSREALHDTLRAQLALPDYYGRTLDALYDCLGDVFEDTELHLLHTGALEAQLGSYAVVLQHVLRDACEENPHLHLIRED